VTTNPLDKLLSLLEQLDQAHIHYRLARNREEAITVEVAVPGQRWEIDVFATGAIEVEVFRSDGAMRGEEAIVALLRDFSD
jgi:hypothetical protein